MNKQTLSLLGLSKKCGDLLVGSSKTIEALKNHECGLVCVCKDVSSDSIRQIKNKCEYYNIPLYFLSKESIDEVSKDAVCFSLKKNIMNIDFSKED